MGKQTILTILMFLSVCHCSLVDDMAAYPGKQFEDTPIYDTYIKGKMQNYMSLVEVKEFILLLKSNFSTILNVTQVGFSFEYNTIWAIELNPSRSKLAKKVMFTGAHHANELATIQMNFYLILKMIYNYQNNDATTLAYMNDTSFIFIPVVNIDGLEEISDAYNATGILLNIRKNRNNGLVDGYAPCANSLFLGVDLNRNYGYQYAYSDTGSSSSKCASDYRGPREFSEPETQYMRKFVQQNKDTIIMAFNFHENENLYLFPFNYDPIQGFVQLKQSNQSAFYDIIRNISGVPISKIFNLHQGKQWQVNGDISDWMQWAYGIVSLSPDFGGTQGGNAVFTSTNTNVTQLKNVLSQNSVWVLNVLSNVQYQLFFSQSNISFFSSNGESQVELILTVINEGLKDSKQGQKVTLKAANDKIVKVKSMFMWDSVLNISTALKFTNQIDQKSYDIALPAINAARRYKIYAYIVVEDTLIYDHGVSQYLSLLNLYYYPQLTSTEQNILTITTKGLIVGSIETSDNIGLFLNVFSITAAFTFVICFILLSWWFVMEKRKMALSRNEKQRPCMDSNIASNDFTNQQEHRSNQYKSHHVPNDSVISEVNLDISPDKGNISDYS